MCDNVHAYEGLLPLITVRVSHSSKAAVIYDMPKPNAQVLYFTFCHIALFQGVTCRRHSVRPRQSCALAVPFIHLGQLIRFCSWFGPKQQIPSRKTTRQFERFIAFPQIKCPREASNIGSADGTSSTSASPLVTGKPRLASLSMGTSQRPKEGTQNFAELRLKVGKLFE